MVIILCQRQNFLGRDKVLRQSFIAFAGLKQKSKPSKI